MLGADGAVERVRGEAGAEGGDAGFDEGDGEGSGATVFMF